MALADKIILAIPIARRARDVNKVKFDILSENGFFLTFDDKKILEFDTSQEATDAKNSLNQAMASIKATLLTNYENKISTILNA